MKKIRIALIGAFLAALAMAFVGCGQYASITGVDDDTVAVAENNSFLFGGNTVYVCDVTGEGLTNCTEQESP